VVPKVCATIADALPGAARLLSAAQRSNVPETSDDLVHYGKQQSMPRDEYRRSRRMVKLWLVAALSPFILLSFYTVTPTAALVFLAEPFNDFFWPQVKQVSLEGCGSKCALVAYSMIAIPLSWLAAIVFAILAVPLTVQLRSAQVEALRRGAAPHGRLPDGKAKPLPTAGISIFVAGAGVVFVGAVLIALLYTLYQFGGSGRTVGGWNRELSLWHVNFLMAIAMGIAQFSATFLMSLATFLVLNVKRLFLGGP